MAKPIEGNQLRGHLEAMILSTLARGEAHGFDVLRRLDAAGSGLLKLKEGSLYPALYRLEAAGAIKGHWEDGASDSRGPRRRLYRLTPKGRRQLQASRQQWRDFVSVIGGIVGAPA